jgi:hypothetical protein
VGRQRAATASGKGVLRIARDLKVGVGKLSATAIATMDGKSFAEALDRAIERSKLPPMLNAPTTELVDATELKKPMSRYRRF